MSICCFCDDNANSKEDAWPLWLVTRFGQPNAVIDAEVGGREFSWASATPKIPVRSVCKRCNNEWMSEIENRTKPIIETVLNAPQAVLSPTDQSTLAIWAIKTSMVMETFDRARVSFYSKDQRQLFRESRRIPPQSWVWIAKCVELPSAFTVANDLSIDERPASPRAHVTTLCFGTLALQVLTLKTLELVPETVGITIQARTGPWQEVVLQVWPPSDAAIIWPARMGLRGLGGITALARRFSPPDHSKGI